MDETDVTIVEETEKIFKSSKKSWFFVFMGAGENGSSYVYVFTQETLTSLEKTGCSIWNNVWTNEDQFVTLLLQISSEEELDLLIFYNNYSNSIPDSYIICREDFITIV